MPVLLADSEVVDCGGRFKGNNGDALKKRYRPGTE
jgi:hypothetical protein